MNNIPQQISVGIVSSLNVSFSLEENYRFGNQIYKGDFCVSVEDDKIEFLGCCYDEIKFEPIDYETSFFVLNDVIIGIDFHWQKVEKQRFFGSLKLIVENGVITAINILSVEDYLVSVISSEMSATSYLELLKAHAVISRSWLLCQFEETKTVYNKEKLLNIADTEMFINRWYERDKHTNYDVCADDRCQRYQGVTKITTTFAREAVEATRGEVLVCNGTICDARFSKSCGGVTETFDTCWSENRFDYLVKVPDNVSETSNLDLTTESAAKKWIMYSPSSFCNVSDEDVLRQVLNNFDQPTKDFFRWKVVYTKQQLADILKRRSGYDFGEILEIIPLKRGVSGRISYLKIVGTKTTVVVGKELEIRKWLSESHLYSSAFIVEKKDSCFIFYGAGWGHGVGLCQIGAAVMSKKGYDYRQILAHYYKNTEIQKIY